MRRAVSLASASDSRSRSRASREAALPVASNAALADVPAPCSRLAALPATMRWRHPPDAMRGFSLLEIAIALAVLAIGLAALAVPLASQVQARRLDEARR